MTDDEIRIAMAERCGIPVGQMDICHCGNSRNGWTHRSEHTFCPMMTMSDLPDYPNDLNALRDAVKSLTPSQKDAMDHYLHLIVERDDDIFVWNASARQMREAFLRAIGKWKEPTNDKHT